MMKKDKAVKGLLAMLLLLCILAAACHAVDCAWCSDSEEENNDDYMDDGEGGGHSGQSCHYNVPYDYAPEIGVLGGGTPAPNSILVCTNCLLPRPATPANAQYTAYYRWYIKRSSGSTTDLYASVVPYSQTENSVMVSCSDILNNIGGNTCLPNSSIKLEARLYWTDHSTTPACTYSTPTKVSSWLQIPATPPENHAPSPAPPKPIIEPLTVSLTNETECVENCPPDPLPQDEDGDAVSVSYLWRKKIPGSESFEPASNWGSSTSASCLQLGCPVGTQLVLSSKACDEHGSCTPESEPSDPATVSSILMPHLANFDMTYILLALLCAVAIMAAAYMATYLFGLAHIRPVINDELLQVVATGIVAFMLLGIQLGLDNYLAAALTNGGTMGMMQAAQLKVEGLSSESAAIMNRLMEVSIRLGQEASRNRYCSFMGVGFSLSNCSQYNLFRNELTTSAMAVVIAMSDVSAQYFLLSLATRYAMTLLVPLGLFLRCFKASRGAGGALIAFGFGFYAVYPTMIVAIDSVLHGQPPPSPPGGNFLPYPQPCDSTSWTIKMNAPLDMYYMSLARGEFADYAENITSFQRIGNATYFVLIRVMFSSILSLMITLVFVKQFAQILGSDIDVSSLARIS